MPTDHSVPDGTKNVKKSEIEQRFKLRVEVSQDLLSSVEEHGVIQAPLILELTQKQKAYFKTKKPYLCIDGHSRLEGIADLDGVACNIVAWDSIIEEASGYCEKIGLKLSDLTYEDIIMTYILRLHACRSPLPREVYIEEAKRLRQKGFSLRQAAGLLGTSKSTLHRWTTASKLQDDDLQSSLQAPLKQCGLCGDWIRRGALPIFFHQGCLQNVVRLLEKTKVEEVKNCE